MYFHLDLLLRGRDLGVGVLEAEERVYRIAELQVGQVVPVQREQQEWAEGI